MNSSNLNDTLNLSGLKVFKPKQLKELFIKYHKWASNKKRCSTKARREGKEAYDLIILHNLKLVSKIAHDYSKVSETVSVEDLVSEGTIGLIRSIDKFDHNKGISFSTYSAFHIKDKIRRFITKKSRDIRIPEHVALKIGKITDYVRDYEEQHKIKPSLSQISKKTRVSKQILNDLLNGGVLNLKSVDFQISGNEEMGGATTWGDIQENPNAVKPDENGLKSNDVENLLDSMNEQLTRREKAILIRRFGMRDGHPETLDNIAAHFGVSRERIRQLQIKSIRKLKQSMGKKYQDNFFIPKYF